MDIEEVRKKKTELSNLILSKILAFKEETSLYIDAVDFDWILVTSLNRAQEQERVLSGIKFNISGL